MHIWMTHILLFTLIINKDEFNLDTIFCVTVTPNYKQTNKQEMDIREKTFGIKTEATTKINACFYANPGSPDSGYNQYSHQRRQKGIMPKKSKTIF